MCEQPWRTPCVPYVDCQGVDGRYCVCGPGQELIPEMTFRNESENMCQGKKGFAPSVSSSSRFEVTDPTLSRPQRAVLGTYTCIPALPKAPDSDPSADWH